MTLNKLASAIAKIEGKKSQARIGDIREILKIICTLDAEAAVDGLADKDGAIYTLDVHAGKIAGKLLAKRKKVRK